MPAGYGPRRHGLRLTARRRGTRAWAADDSRSERSVVRVEGGGASAEGRLGTRRWSERSLGRRTARRARGGEPEGEQLEPVAGQLRDADLDHAHRVELSTPARQVPHGLPRVEL